MQAALGPVVDASPRRRAEYSSDASNYRVVPEAVVFPRSADDVLGAAAVCRELAVPLTVRGGGTSIAGNAVGPGVVLDMSRHLDRVVSIDPGARTATVQPGVILDQLQRAAGRHGLRFGPDPSSHSRCTVGGMIGNNACGAHAMAYGTTAANVVALDVLDGTGRRLRIGAGGDAVPGLDAFVAQRVAPLRGEFGRFPRQVSGYSLEHLLPERDGSLARALAGTEGTCGIVLGATVSLVPLPPATALCVLGYPDMAAAADDAPDLVGHGPLALEGIDARLVDVVRAYRANAELPRLPRGNAWLFAEVGGSGLPEALAAARSLVAASAAVDSLVVSAGAAAAALWRIREDGAGLGSRTAAGAPAWPAWEDAAVPTAKLGPYLRDFTALLESYRLDGLLYGHFGDGCVHVRIDLPLEHHPERLRPFLNDAAHLVAAYGGSLSGEHGDGRARGELLPIMYSAAAIDAFAAFKALFDPRGLLNPGVIVDPRPVDADLRLPEARPLRGPGGFALTADDGDLSRAAHRCVGIGKCRADNGPAGGFMCPSYLATRDEKDSTRGRARVLQELANGSLVTGGWRSPEVHEALDLCLSCKACSRDCPVSVDMATYKSEVLHHAYRGRLRPRSHYALGWLPAWTRLAAVAPGLVNLILRNGVTASLVRRLGGIDSRRPLPALARHPASPARLRRQVAASAAVLGGPDPAPGDSRGWVVLWADTFTRAFSPQVADSAAAVLAEAGFQVIVPDYPLCCGLTWISTGQLERARARLRATVAGLTRYAERGLTIVGLEPSCVAVLRGDLGELLPGDTWVGEVAAATRTLAETLTGAGPGPGPPPDLSWLDGRLAGQRVIAQPHCHHHAVMGYDADLAVLRAAGAAADTLAGCCGLAGNFGMERGHYEVSVAVAEQALLPALRAAPEGTVLLADGFSCRTQASQLAGWPALHLAELLDPRRG
ncbi:MAG TPA: FAD-binding and (Fe-S)-binding domain-containing protein [Streptosporangiaceae bacterium]|nr:FAD-binding and (Fe-S)-binding domain-containing protein [Streptosporangiaceae bacterium]